MGLCSSLSSLLLSFSQKTIGRHNSPDAGTHAVDLFCGEMTVTLQDVNMILGLPIQGKPVTMKTDTDGWRDKMRSLIGKEPGVAGKSAGATYFWIKTNFSVCPPDHDEDSEVVQQYARAYCWYVVSRVLFADSTGDRAPFMWLQLFAGWEHNFSWATAVLAYLYRQVTNCKYCISILLTFKIMQACGRRCLLVYRLFLYLYEFKLCSLWFVYRCVCSWTRHAVGAHIQRIGENQLKPISVVR